MRNIEGTGSLEFKPDFAEAQQRWLAFWEHEIIDRPCCIIRAPKAGLEPPPAPKYMAEAHGDFGLVIEQILAHAAAIWWGGEAMPAHSPSFGPDMMAAWLGAELHFPEQEVGTSWVVPCLDDWEEALPLRLDPENYWWRRMLGFCTALAAAAQGKMIIAHLDLHSNLDALLALRGGQQLCLDLLDIPATIDRAMRQVRALYAPLYEALYEAGNMGPWGTQCWVPAYHPVRTCTIQCDFAALIGPEHFRRWALPALADEAAFLGHCVYHLDGPECLVHLDDVCAVEGIDCIQFATGAGNKPFIEWMDVFKEIQARGLAMHIVCDTETIKIFHRELQPELLFYDCVAPSQAEGEKTLEWLGQNT